MGQYRISKNLPSSDGGNYHKSSSVKCNFPNLVGEDFQFGRDFRTIKFGSRFSEIEGYSELLVYGVTGNIPLGGKEVGTHYLGKLRFAPAGVDQSKLNEIVAFLCSQEGFSELEKIAVELL